MSSSSSAGFKPTEPPPAPPFNSLSPIKGGVLTKQGKQIKSWKKRIFILQGVYLYYYCNASDSKPRGTICIKDCKAQEEEAIGKSQKAYCFSVLSHKSWNINLNKQFASRTYYFCTASFQDMSDWISIINTMSTGETLDNWSIYDEPTPNTLTSLTLNTTPTPTTTLLQLSTSSSSSNSDQSSSSSSSSSSSNNQPTLTSTPTPIARLSAPI